MALYSGSARPKRAGVGATTVPLRLVVAPPGHSALLLTSTPPGGSSAALSIWLVQPATSKAVHSPAGRESAASQPAPGRAVPPVTTPMGMGVPQISGAGVRFCWPAQPASL